MRLDLGHDIWRLKIETPLAGDISAFGEVAIETGMAQIKNGLGVETYISLTARREEGSRALGGLALYGLKLTDMGFEADGLGILEEDGDTHILGRQTWTADRLYHI